MLYLNILNYYFFNLNASTSGDEMPFTKCLKWKDFPLQTPIPIYLKYINVLSKYLCTSFLLTLYSLVISSTVADVHYKTGFSSYSARMQPKCVRRGLILLKAFIILQDNNNLLLKASIILLNPRELTIIKRMKKRAAKFANNV